MAFKTIFSFQNSAEAFPTLSFPFISLLNPFFPEWGRSCWGDSLCCGLVLSQPNLWHSHKETWSPVHPHSFPLRQAKSFYASSIISCFWGSKEMNK